MSRVLRTFRCAPIQLAYIKGRPELSTVLTSLLTKQYQLPVLRFIQTDLIFDIIDRYVLSSRHIHAPRLECRLRCCRRVNAPVCLLTG